MISFAPDNDCPQNGQESSFIVFTSASPSANHFSAFDKPLFFNVLILCEINVKYCSEIQSMLFWSKLFICLVLNGKVKDLIFGNSSCLIITLKSATYRV